MKTDNLAKNFLKYFFFFVCALLAIRLLIVVTHFNFVLTDNDQVLFWYGCHNFSRGIFYTPFIYGCDYGSMFESFIAVPFYKMGMPLYYALPFSNVFWTFLLCIILGYQLNKIYPKHQLGALFILIFSLLPTDCYAILFAAKGHLAGILLALAAMILVVKYTTKPFLIFSGVLAGLAFQLNPNSVFLILLIFLFVPNIKNALLILIGTVGSLFYSLITSHYSQILDSEFLHKQWKLTFKMSFLLEHVDYMDKYLNNVTPLFSKLGFLSLLLPVILAIMLFTKKDWIKGSIILLFAVMLFMSFGFSKVSDGSVDVFFHYCRFYLALAFCNALIIPFLIMQLPVNNYYNILLAAIFCISVFFTIKTSSKASYLANRPGETYAVERKFVADIVDHTNWMKQKLEEAKQKNPIIIATDYVFFSENLFLSTMKLPNVTCCFENYKKFYWLAEIMENKKNAYDIFIILSFKDRLERKINECPQYLHQDKVTPYFVVRNVRQPATFIETFLK